MASKAEENPNPDPDHNPTPTPTPNPISHQRTYKSRLLEYTQKSGLVIPNYHTVIEASHEGPRFKSTVTVDGMAYESQRFLHRKEAEHNAAKIALDAIMKKLKEEVCPMLDQSLNLFKSILNEFAVKSRLEFPEYTTIRMNVGGTVSIFVSTVVFQGKTYTGPQGKNKKEAEQLAARNIIQSYLGTESEPLIYQVLSQKRRYFAAVQKAASESNGLQIVHSQNSAQVANVPPADQDIPPLKKPKQEYGETSHAATQEMTPTPAVATAVLDEQLSVDQAGITGGQVSTTARKKKNKKKGESKLLVGERVPAAHSMRQSSPSLVAQ